MDPKETTTNTTGETLENKAADTRPNPNAYTTPRESAPADSPSLPADKLPNIVGAPTPKTTPAPKAGPETVQVGDDIVKILEEVQLPQRVPEQALPESGRTIAQQETKTPVQEPSAPDSEVAAAATETPQKPDGTLPTLRTLGGDLKRLVRVDNLSMVRAASLESDRRNQKRKEIAEAPDSPLPKRHRRHPNLLIWVTILLILGGSAVIGAYYYLTNTPAQSGTSATIPPSDLMFAESTVPLATAYTSAATLKHWLAQARSSVTLSLGAITRIVPTTRDTDPETLKETERIESAAEFLASIEANAPDELTRALGNNFFFGLHSIGENVPITIFTINSYERAFSGMLSWEQTMNQDLSPIYTQLPVVKDAVGAIQGTTFEDLVIRNYDTRVLRDANGDIKMLYAFPNRSLLIIAESPYSFTEALSRLRAARKL